MTSILSDQYVQTKNSNLSAAACFIAEDIVATCALWCVQLTSCSTASGKNHHQPDRQKKKWPYHRAGTQPILAGECWVIKITAHFCIVL